MDWDILCLMLSFLYITQREESIPFLLRNSLENAFQVDSGLKGNGPGCSLRESTMKCEFEGFFSTGISVLKQINSENRKLWFIEGLRQFYYASATVNQLVLFVSTSLSFPVDREELLELSLSFSWSSNKGIPLSSMLSSALSITHLLCYSTSWNLANSWKERFNLLRRSWGRFMDAYS